MAAIVTDSFIPQPPRQAAQQVPQHPAAQATARESARESAGKVTAAQSSPADQIGAKPAITAENSGPATRPVSHWTPSGEADAHGHANPAGEDQDLSFGDFLDVINPLQHLPVVGNLYREMTGDQITPTARVAGGFLWGGPLGLMGATANVAVEEGTGRDIGQNAVAWLAGEDPSVPGETGVAPALAGTGPGDPATATAAATTHGTTVAAASKSTPETAQDSTTPRNINAQAASQLDAFIQANGGGSAFTAQDIAAQYAAKYGTGSTETGPAALAAQAGRDPALEAAAIRQSLQLEPGRSGRGGDASERPTTGTSETKPDGARLVAGPVGSRTEIGTWMTQALDKYNQMRGTS